MSLALDSPAFMGRGMTSPNANIHDGINSGMSPLQAFHVGTVLVDQKISDPDFQVTLGSDHWSTLT
jgi:hypothetical protein